jgi:energy-coupling factor transporter transmembrane protein EcfT
LDPYLYLDRNTWVHRLDPRTKMLVLLGTFVLAVLFLNPLYQLVVLGVVVAFGAAARSLINLKRIWFILLMVAVMSAILWSIFSQGETPLFLFVERESLLYGIGVALRIDITIIAGMIFLSTTRNEEIAGGLVKLGIPYRFAFAVSTALRLVPTVATTGATIGQAQRSRGLDLDSGAFSSGSASTSPSSSRSSSPPSARRTCFRWRWSRRASARARNARTTCGWRWAAGTWWPCSSLQHCWPQHLPCALWATAG